MLTMIPKCIRSRAGNRLPVYCILLATLALGAPLSAHVQLDAPNGGEVVTAGAQIEIEWHVLISHGTENWDLAYSTTGGTEPWIPIAEDLPPGDITSGAMHSFLWTVPAVDSNEVRVRVTQDNSGVDYTDESDDDLTIEPDLAADEIFFDGFESGDGSAWSAVVP